MDCVPLNIKQKTQLNYQNVFQKNNSFAKQCKSCWRPVKSTIFNCFQKIRINSAKKNQKCHIFQRRKKCIDNKWKKERKKGRI